jgi:aspartyl/asparaginyl beta-hydroxylase (cupin superfamily)
MQGLPANIFKSGILRTANSVTRPSPSLFSFIGLTSTPFWDKASFYWSSNLEEKCSEIKKEYDLHSTTSKSDYEIKGDEHSLHHGEWEWRSFIKRGNIEKAFQSSCPITSEALLSIPELQKDIPFAYSFFSTMKPGTSIDQHTAPCNIRLRGHLPLTVPDDDVCGITVGGLTKHYKEGELIIFDDSFPHETWHNGVQGSNSGSSKDRVVLLFDVWHPDLTFEERAAIVEMFEIAQSQQQ